MQRCFRVNTGPVVFENYGSESLAINLDTGAYYSLTGPASRLWAMLTEGSSTSRIAEYFAAAHEGNRDQIKESVGQFLARLEEEKLIIEDLSAVPAQPAVPAPVPSDRTPFEDFEMRVFTDMKDLLLLDPIHDADEAGWPVANG